MEIQDYQNLKNKLETIKNNHRDKYKNLSNGYLDASYISVKMFGDWRLKKKVGCKKQYQGWSFFTASANSNGYDLYEEINNACKDFNLLLVTEKQL
jgi:hypothetical protein|tara:strand:- start:3 stop:290 length:288 start_codon:yes stop_codon:yes gene_type:complete